MFVFTVRSFVDKTGADGLTEQGGGWLQRTQDREGSSNFETKISIQVFPLFVAYNGLVTTTTTMTMMTGKGLTTYFKHFFLETCSSFRVCCLSLYLLCCIQKASTFTAADVTKMKGPRELESLFTCSTLI